MVDNKDMTKVFRCSYIFLSQSPAIVEIKTQVKIFQCYIGSTVSHNHAHHGGSLYCQHLQLQLLRLWAAAAFFHME